MAGKNRVELEKVLNHYSDDPADSLKYKSAVFLIENMPEKYGYKGTAIDKKIEAFGYLEKETDSIPADIVDIANSQFKERSEKVYDIKVITSEYLIEHIDIAYSQWKTIAWNKNLSFDDFCEYLLPYRLENEPLMPWRKEYLNKYGKIIDSLCSGTDAVEAANQLNLYIGQTEKVIYSNEIQYICLGPIFYMDNKQFSKVFHLPFLRVI